MAFIPRKTVVRILSPMPFHAHWAVDIFHSFALKILNVRFGKEKVDKYTFQIIPNRFFRISELVKESTLVSNNWVHLCRFILKGVTLQISSTIVPTLVYVSVTAASTF